MLVQRPALQVRLLWFQHQLYSWPQGSPSKPTLWQVPETQESVTSVHQPLQHDCPCAPQLPQLPFEQVPPAAVQAVPLATQVPLRSQQPPPQARLPAQHG